MKKLILFCLLTSVHSLHATDNKIAEVYYGNVHLLAHHGTQAGLRLSWPLNKWIQTGIGASTELHLSKTAMDNKSRKASFLRANVVLKLLLPIGRFEPYVVGTLGKDIVGENPLPYSPENIEKEQWFDSQLGASLDVGIAFHFSKFKIGAEMGGGMTGTGYTDYNIVLGFGL